MFRMASLLVIAFAVLGGVGVSYGQTVGDWHSGTIDSTLYAVSVNDSGHIFGQFCYPGDGGCYWLIGLTTACKKGDEYLALANSDAGAVHLKVHCDGQLENGRYRYTFTDFDLIASILRDAKRAVGFAIPLSQTEFVVVRFSLRGATATISTMRVAAETRAKPATLSTRDQLM